MTDSDGRIPVRGRADPAGDPRTEKKGMSLRAWMAKNGWIFALAPLPLILFVPWAFAGVWALWLVMWGLAAVVGYRRSRSLPEFTRLSPGSIYRAESSGDYSGLVIGLYIIALMFVVLCAVIPFETEPGIVFMIDLIAAIGILLCALVAWVHLRARFRVRLVILRAVAAAPALPADPEDGAWGTVEGRLRARMEMSGLRKKDHSDTSATNWWWTCQGRQEFSGPLEVETGAGRIVVESSDDGLWATTERVVKHHAADAQQDRIVEKIPENGGVIALGKIRLRGDAPHLVATGKESLILFGTREGANGREALARCLGSWRLTLLPLAAAAALGLVVAGTALVTAMRDAAVVDQPAAAVPYAPVVLPPLPAPYPQQGSATAPPVVEAPITR